MPFIREKAFHFLKIEPFYVDEWYGLIKMATDKNCVMIMLTIKRIYTDICVSNEFLVEKDHVRFNSFFWPILERQV